MEEEELLYQLGACSSEISLQNTLFSSRAHFLWAPHPSVNLSGKAKQKIDKLGINKSTSISHDGEYSIAFVILEKI